MTDYMNEVIALSDDDTTTTNVSHATQSIMDKIKQKTKNQVGTIKKRRRVNKSQDSNGSQVQQPIINYLHVVSKTANQTETPHEFAPCFSGMGQILPQAGQMLQQSGPQEIQMIDDNNISILPPQYTAAQFQEPTYDMDLQTPEINQEQQFKNSIIMSPILSKELEKFQEKQKRKNTPQPIDNLPMVMPTLLPGHRFDTFQHVFALQTLAAQSFIDLKTSQGWKYNPADQEFPIVEQPQDTPQPQTQQAQEIDPCPLQQNKIGQHINSFLHINKNAPPIQQEEQPNDDTVSEFSENDNQLNQIDQNNVSFNEPPSPVASPLKPQDAKIQSKSKKVQPNIIEREILEECEKQKQAAIDLTANSQILQNDHKVLDETQNVLSQGNSETNIALAINEVKKASQPAPEIGPPCFTIQGEIKLNEFTALEDTSSLILEEVKAPPPVFPQLNNQQNSGDEQSSDAIICIDDQEGPTLIQCQKVSKDKPKKGKNSQNSNSSKTSNPSDDYFKHMIGKRQKVYRDAKIYVGRKHQVLPSNIPVKKISPPFTFEYPDLHIDQLKHSPDNMANQQDMRQFLKWCKGCYPNMLTFREDWALQFMNQLTHSDLARNSSTPIVVQCKQFSKEFKQALHTFIYDLKNNEKLNPEESRFFNLKKHLMEKQQFDLINQLDHIVDGDPNNGWEIKDDSHFFI